MRCKHINRAGYQKQRIKNILMDLNRKLILFMISIFAFQGCAVQDKSDLDTQWRNKAISLASACHVSWLSDQSIKFINGPSTHGRREFIDHFKLDKVEGRKILVAETAGLSDKFSIFLGKIDGDPKIYYLSVSDNKFEIMVPGYEYYEHHRQILDFSESEMMCDSGTGVFSFYIILET